MSTVLARVRELLENDNLRNEGKMRESVSMMISGDVTAFMVWFIENLPKIFDKKNQPDIPNRFFNDYS